MNKEDALFIMGMGGPENIESIEPFLYNLFSDRDIIDFHIGDFLQRFVAKKIAKKRAKKLAPEYMKMGYNGASPQVIIHRKIFNKLKIKYKEVYNRARSYKANCYYHPFFNEALEILNNNQWENVIFTTVYPQYSLTTVEACFNRLAKDYNLYGAYDYKSIIIPYWYSNDKYCNAISKRIKEAAKKLCKDIESCHVLYSAHLVPLSYVEKGDPYPMHIKKHVEIINNITGIKNYYISYQSKVGPVKWMSPSTIDTITNYKNGNIDNIIIVPISFISDHIETLIEIDEQLIPLLDNTGKKIIRIDSLNDSDDFIEALNSVLDI